MIRTMIRSGIGVFALVALSACATQERAEPLAEEAMKCAHYETLTCDRFSGENHNCTCEKGDNLRDMLDAYPTPGY